MSKMRKPCSDFKYLSMSFQALECLGIRGPVSTVGLEEDCVSCCALLNKLRIASSLLKRRLLLPAENKPIAQGSQQC